VLPSTATRERVHNGLTQRGEQPAGNWQVLRNHHRFRTFFCGSVISDLGTWMQNTAQVLLAYQIAHHSVLMVGLVACAQFSSPLVLSPLAGVATDRFGGRRTLLVTQVVAAMVAGGLGYLELTGSLNGWWLGTGALLSGICFTFALPARNVTVRRLIHDEGELQPAFAMDSVSYNLGRAIAPLMGILLVPWVGYASAFFGNAASFIVFTMILWASGRNASAEPERRSRITDGFQIAKDDHMIMALLLMVAAVTVADDPVLVLGPALTSRMHVATSYSGWFIAALGVGCVLGALLPSRGLPSLQGAAIALASLGGCMIVFVVTPWFWVSVAAALGAGVSCLVANSATRALLSQAAGPDRVAAVMAVWAIAWAGSKPFASLADGLLAGWVGVGRTGIILAIPALIPLAVLVLMPELERKLTSYHPLLVRPPGVPEARPAAATIGQAVIGPEAPAAGAPAGLRPTLRQSGPQSVLVLSEGVG